MPKTTKEVVYTNRHHDSNDLKHEVFKQAHKEYQAKKKEERMEEIAEKLRETARK